MITREFDLMLYQEGNLLFINANQYDSGEQWIFTLYEENGVKYTPATGAIVGVKSDGKGIINTGTVDEYGRVVINETKQMTAAAGLATFELLIDNDTHGTANFKVDVEPRPADNADLSDSDLSLIQEAVNSAAEIEELLGGQDVPTVITPIISDWLDENITNPSNPPIDTSLTVAGAAADAKATGDEITDLNSAIFTTESVPVTWERGSIGVNGLDGYNVHRLRTVGYINASAGTVIALNDYTTYKYSLLYYKSDYTIDHAVYWNTNNITITYDSIIRLVIAAVAGDNTWSIDESQADALGDSILTTQFTKQIYKSDFVYSLTDSWLSKVNGIQKAQGKNFCFGIQTDTHFLPTADSTVIYPFSTLTKYIGFDFIANLGDVIHGYDGDDTATMQTAMTEAMKRYQSNLKCPIMVAIGNHDDCCLYTASGGTGNYSLDECILPDEQYAKMIMPVLNSTNIMQSGKSFYWYKDFADYRVIMLYTRDIEWQAVSVSDIGINHHAISSAQVSWFTTEALNTNKPVIIMCHVPLYSAVLADSNTVANADQILAALAAFKNNGGTVVGCFYGHVHRQDAAVDANGINHITFDNGGNFAEVVIVGDGTIETKMIGDYPTADVDRSFTF